MLEEVGLLHGKRVYKITDESDEWRLSIDRVIIPFLSLFSHLPLVDYSAVSTTTRGRAISNSQMFGRKSATASTAIHQDSSVLLRHERVSIDGYPIGWMDRRKPKRDTSRVLPLSPRRPNRPKWPNSPHQEIPARWRTVRDSSPTPSRDAT